MTVLARIEDVVSWRRGCGVKVGGVLGQNRVVLHVAFGCLVWQTGNRNFYGVSEVFPMHFIAKETQMMKFFEKKISKKRVFMVQMVETSIPVEYQKVSSTFIRINAS